MRHFRSQNGLSLIEIMATIAVLGVAIAAIVSLLQTGTATSRHNQELDQAVMLTRTVMEEVKNHLKQDDAITVFGQPINLKQLRESAPYQQEIGWPAASPEYRIRIESTVPGEVYEVNSEFHITGAHFRKITVTCEYLPADLNYELESYVEI